MQQYDSITESPPARRFTLDEVSTLLWDDRQVLAARHEKSAAALVSVHGALEREHPLGGKEDEFLALYRILREMDAGAFTAVWSDPYGYFWLRLAYELLAGLQERQALSRLANDYCRSIGESDPQKALERHLGDFKRILLGAHVRSARDIRFDTPLTVDLPFAIPGTSYSLVGDGSAAIIALSGGQLSVLYDGGATIVPLEANTDQVGLRVERCPSVRYHGCEVRLQPAAYNLPALDFSELVIASGLGYQREYGAVMEPALKALEAHAPDIFEQFRDFIQVMALKPSNPGSYRDNLSHSDLPGAIVAQPIANPYYFAHVFVHEFHHNRLFCIEELGHFFEDSGESLELVEKFYSPWRVDPRPMHGVFHALYVTIPVVQYWLSVHRAEDTDAATKAMALDQLLYGLQQMRIASFQIGRHPGLTSFGHTLFNQMRNDVEALEREARQLEGPAEVVHTRCLPDGTVERIPNGVGWLTVQQAIAEHINAYASADESREVRRHLGI